VRARGTAHSLALRSKSQGSCVASLTLGGLSPSTTALACAHGDGERGRQGGGDQGRGDRESESKGK